MSSSLEIRRESMSYRDIDVATDADAMKHASRIRRRVDAHSGIQS